MRYFKMNESTAEATPKAGGVPQTFAQGLIHDARVYIRRNPTRALAIAVGTGFVLQSAPVGRLIGGLARVGFALLRPALIVLGGIKIWEKVKHREIL